MKSPKKRLKGVSLFSSGGIGEAFFEDTSVDIIVANELLKDRAELYAKMHKKTNMIVGDILDDMGIYLDERHMHFDPKTKEILQKVRTYLQSSQNFES